MLPLLPVATGEPLRVLCFGAHADDVEIGAGAALLRLQADRPVHVRAVIFSASPQRRAEQEAASAMLFAAATDYELIVHDFRESFFPDQWAAIKGALTTTPASLPISYSATGSTIATRITRR